MPRLRSPQWRDDNELSNFPFEDRATLLSNEGDLLLSGLLLDAVLYPAGGQSQLYLSSVTLTSSLCTLTVGDDDNAELCTGSFSLQELPDSVWLVDSLGRDSGLLVSEPLRLANFQAWSIGTHTFEPDATPFVAAVVQPVPWQAVTGVLLPDGTLLTGEVWLVGGAGIILSQRSHSEPSGETVSVVRADAVGDPLFRRSRCSPGAFQTPRLLQRLVVQKDGRSYTLLPGGEGQIRLRVGSQLSESTILQICTFDNGLEVRAIGEQLRDTL